MMVSHLPAAPCEHQKSPPWSSWSSNHASVTISDWDWAPSPPARLAPSQESSSGSQLRTDSTLSAAGEPDLTGYYICRFFCSLKACSLLLLLLILICQWTNLFLNICDDDVSVLIVQLPWTPGCSSGCARQQFTQSSSLLQTQSSPCSVLETSPDQSRANALWRLPWEECGGIVQVPEPLFNRCAYFSERCRSVLPFRIFNGLTL